MLSQQTPPDLILPVSHSKLLNDSGAKEFRRFTNRMEEFPKAKVEVIQRLLEGALDRSFTRREHYLAIKPFLKVETPYARVLQRSEQNFLYEARQAVLFATEMGARINPELLTKFEETGQIDTVSLERAE